MSLSVSRWVPRVTLGLSIAGLAVSVYLSITHFRPRALFCSSTGVINCGRVTSSPQSNFLGIPVAFLGTAYFIEMAILNLPTVWRGSSTAVRRIRLGSAAAGVAFVVWLVYAELYLIRAICLWCTVTHVIAFVLFAVIVTASIGAGDILDDDEELEEE